MSDWLKRNPLGLILALSILLRLGAAVYLGDQIVALPGTQDQISYDALAQNVARGEGFVFDKFWYPFTRPNTPTAHWSFLYVSYLAGVYALLGHHPLLARLIQALIVGALMPWLVYRLGRRTFNRPVGLAAALAISVYVYLVYYSAALMTESFYIVALLWSLDALQRIAKGAGQPGKWPWVELGLAWGIATLLRQQVLLLVPVLLAWLLWAGRPHFKLRRFLQSAALSLAIVAAFILPWTVRNYVVYQEFLPLNSNVGWALYAANHPVQGNRFEPLNYPKPPVDLEGMNEAEMNTWLAVEGIRFVLEEPGRFALQSLDRFRNYFRFWPEPTSSLIANVSRVLSFGLYLPFMLYGLFLSLRGKSYATRNTQYRILFYLYIFTYSAMHLLTWAMHRYRLPVDAVLMVFVGVAGVDLYRRVQHMVVSRRRLEERPSP